MSGRVSIVLSDVELNDRRCDVELRDGRVSRIGTGLTGADVRVRADGGALLPGLHDHHVHLLAYGATRNSVDVAHGLGALAGAEPINGWLRGVGLDEPLDRDGLDAIRSDLPVRVQHRGGSLWVLNTAAVDAIDAQAATVAGIERDGSGRVTGRLWRLDTWLAERVPRSEPDLARLGAELAAMGITGATDASPDLSVESQALLERLPQRVTVLTSEPDRLRAGPRKIVVSDHELPPIETIVAQIRSARAAGRAVAVHAVTRTALVLTLAAFDETGSVPGDRIEHAAVVPTELIDVVRRLGLIVVTQPSLVTRRGDDYLDRADPDDVAHLWRFRSLLDAGIPTVASSDAPYGDPDPWASMRAARDRLTPTGRVLGAGERVEPSTSLRGFLTRPDDPAGAPRRVEVGVAADLVLLHVPLSRALADPSAAHVRSTFIGGHPEHTAE